MVTSISRRAILAGGVVVATGSGYRSGAAEEYASAFSLPIGLPGRPLGDGFIIRHGYACENTWYNPGWWHTGEDWYRLDGDTAGASIYAVTDGEIVFAGSDYPGRVVIVRHAEDLYSLYGHLDYALSADQGTVVRGDLLGTVLNRTDGAAPSHLHFEMRTFLMTPEVNGDAPRYGVGCGLNCPPGPGYWPVDAPEHPSEMGWRNPMHVIVPRATLSQGSNSLSVIVAEGAPGRVAVWSLPSDRADAEEIGVIDLAAGDRWPLVDMTTGPEATTRTSAEGYRVWYRTRVLDSGPGWIEGVVPDADDTGSDDRPSSVRLVLVPAINA
jgi:hypothetical protein